jgi:ferritin-like metal-binding protein YciE
MPTTKTSRSSNGKQTRAKSAATSNGRQRNTKTTKNNEHTSDGKDALMKLFEHALKDMYWVEKSLTRAIPKMIRKAESEELISALEDHLEVTEGQVDKLERVFRAIDKTPRAKKCVGMAGIIEEGEELLKEFEGEPVLDGAIIAAASKVEHYEMSSYMSMITLAETLDLPKEAALLQEILNEEMEADKLLNSLAGTIAHEAAISTQEA